MLIFGDFFSLINFLVSSDIPLFLYKRLNKKYYTYSKDFNVIMIHTIFKILIKYHKFKWNSFNPLKYKIKF